MKPMHLLRVGVWKYWQTLQEFFRLQATNLKPTQERNTNICLLMAFQKFSKILTSSFLQRCTGKHVKTGNEWFWSSGNRWVLSLTPQDLGTQSPFCTWRLIRPRCRLHSPTAVSRAPNRDHLCWWAGRPRSPRSLWSSHYLTLKLGKAP